MLSTGTAWLSASAWLLLLLLQQTSALPAPQADIFQPTSNQEITAASPQFCNQTDQPFVPGCWDVLNVTGLLHSWKSFPMCAANKTPDQSCCGSGEVWSNCFLRVAYGSPGANCTNVEDESRCKWQAVPLSSNAPVYGSNQYLYVVRAIYSIQNIFYLYNSILSPNVAGLASNIMQILTQSVDPSGQATYKSTAPSIALLAGLPFAGDPINSNVTSGMATADQQAAEAIYYGLQNAPEAASDLFSTQALSTGMQQTTKLSQYSSTFANNVPPNVSGRLQAALNDLSSNVELFANFTQGGGFISDSSISFIGTADAAAFSVGLKTFVTSTAFSGNGYMVSVTPTDLSAQQACLASDPQNFFCGGTKAVWFDVPNNLTFQLVHSSSSSGKTAGGPSAWRTIFTQNYTTPQDLFQGAYNCTIQGDASAASSNGQVVGLSNLNTTGPDYGCLSTLRVCKGATSSSTAKSGVASVTIPSQISACPSNVS